ncbi:hypothetical protein BHE74_00048543 [Ensete ventricosum]|nr:hypothetical protein BHE74_00048543 [Ensete ventricosum]
MDMRSHIEIAVRWHVRTRAEVVAPHVRQVVPGGSEIRPPWTLVSITCCFGRQGSRRHVFNKSRTRPSDLFLRT